MKGILVVVIIVLIIWNLGYFSVENYRSCGICDQRVNMEKNAVINPFVYPYSGNGDPDIINAQESAAKLQHRNTPDHVPETE